jgi:protein-S-isoprenylcysteine O-methyltransferase Ste14
LTFSIPQLSPHSWPLWITAGVWAVFSVYWDAARKNAAPALRSESRGSRRLHVFLVNAALILVLAPVPGFRQRYLPVSPMVIAAGFAIQLAGLLLAIRARRHLGRNWSGEIAINVDHELVRSGPYAWVRHPIYTALLGMYAGSAIVSGEWHALLGLALAAIAYGRKIRHEEAMLMQTFGAQYREYRDETSS